ncbi:MAG TPA: Uma2 family endonuclease [Planctomycetaceae bacterium]|nr:Uma2 family endonuclease [Planctomycetaceae bacterium]
MSTALRKKRFVLGRRHNGIRMTPAEFDAITDFDELYAYELINGVVIVHAYPSRFERDPNEELGHWLRNYHEQHPGHIDKTVFEEYIRVENGRRRADRVIWIGLGRGPDPETDIPTIAIEFVSRRRRDWLRDCVEKRGEYLALGIGEYWIIDRFRRTLTVYRKAPTGFDEQVVTEREIYQTALLPGFELSLGKLLKVCDDWKK